MNDGYGLWQTATTHAEETACCCQGLKVFLTVSSAHDTSRRLTLTNILQLCDRPWTEDNARQLKCQIE